MGRLVVLIGLFIVCLLIVLSINSCEYIPHKIYELKTIDGQIIKLSCPELGSSKNTLITLYNKECYVIK